MRARLGGHGSGRRGAPNRTFERRDAGSTYPTQRKAQRKAQRREAWELTDGIDEEVSFLPPRKGQGRWPWALLL